MNRVSSIFSLGVLDASVEERSRLIEEVLLDPAVRESWERLTNKIEGEGRASETLYSYQQVEVEGRRTLGRPDMYRLFCERGLQLAARNGLVGWPRGTPKSGH